MLLNQKHKNKINFFCVIKDAVTTVVLQTFLKKKQNYVLHFKKRGVKAIENTKVCTVGCYEKVYY